MAEDKFLFGIENDLEKSFIVGKGNVFLLAGWCYHTAGRTKKLYVLVDGSPRPVPNFGLVRSDIFGQQYGDPDFNGKDLMNGFWVTIPFAAIPSKRRVNLGIRAELKNGEIHEVGIGAITLEPEVTRQPVSVGQNDTLSMEGPLVAICMTTYNPAKDLFKRQVDSIIEQTHRNWICIINDDCSAPESFDEIRKAAEKDGRFRLYRNASNIGVEANVELCLSRVPEQASFITISDQDDCWHEDKLSVLVSSFDVNTSLVYSDMNIVNEKGKRIFNTYWIKRKNNFEELDLLILANTITGASSMFRKELLARLLPLPRLANLYYDNFIGCIALCQGNIKYVDRPLYDYYQHSSNVIGHCVPAKDNSRREKVCLFEFRKRLVRTLGYYYEFYFAHYARRVVLANVLKLRCTPSGEKQAVIERFMSLEGSARGLVLQVVKDRFLCKKDITMGIDSGILKSVISKNIINSYFRFRNISSKR
jgi:glycosyltransferase involved in cell wall biosynthesis